MFRKLRNIKRINMFSFSLTLKIFILIEAWTEHRAFSLMSVALYTRRHQTKKKFIYFKNKIALS